MKSLLHENIDCFEKELLTNSLLSQFQFWLFYRKFIWDKFLYLNEIIPMKPLEFEISHSVESYNKKKLPKIAEISTILKGA